jgi:hypothetical protein
MSSVCNTLGNISNAGSLVGLAVQGAVGLAVGYQTIGSPHTTLQETWETLRNIKTHLDAVNPKRRQKIEAAASKRQCRSLEDIEHEYYDRLDAHSELSLKYDQSSYIQRHLFGELRSMINNLEVEVKALLNDTRATTRAQSIIRPTPLPPGDQGDSMDITLAGRPTSPSNPDVNHEVIEMTPV